MKLLEKIDIQNYRSFLSNNCEFNSLTTIVGANESGKTNTLKSIFHLSDSQQAKAFDNGDLRLDCPGFPHNASVGLVYYITIDSSLAPQSCKIMPSLERKTATLTKSGKLKRTPVWDLKLSISPKKIPDFYKIGKKTELKKQLKGHVDANVINTWLSQGWLCKEPSIDTSLNSNPFIGLIRSRVIEKLDDKHKKNHIQQLLLDEIKRNIKIIYWSYTEKNYLPDIVPIEDFLTRPESFQSIDNIFQIAGWEKNHYRPNLLDLDVISRNQLLKSVEDTINGLIKANWTSHRKLKISLSFNGPNLTLELLEPGHKTPPNFRSDGFKWFLTFLLFFRKHSKKLENNIILIDEPGLYLHPKGQKDILKELIELSKKNQIIYSTHQTFLIDRNNPESVRVITREAHKVGRKIYYDSCIKPINDDSNILTDKLVREALGFIVSDVSPINEKNILVEGTFDRDLLLELNSHLKILDFNDISIINCSGAPHIKSLSALCKSNGLDIVCLYDSDQAGLSAFKAARAVEKKNKTHYKLILGSECKIETVEDLIPEDIYNSALNKWINKNKISGATSIILPRMKSINQLLKDKSQDEKLALKHDLEDSLIGQIRASLPNNLQQYNEVKQVLSTFRGKL